MQFVALSYIKRREHSCTLVTLSFPSQAQQFSYLGNTADACLHTCAHIRASSSKDYPRPVHAMVSLGYLQCGQDNADTALFSRESLPGHDSLKGCDGIKFFNNSIKPVLGLDKVWEVDTVQVETWEHEYHYRYLPNIQY